MYRQQDCNIKTAPAMDVEQIFIESLVAEKGVGKISIQKMFETEYVIVTMDRALINLHTIRTNG